MRCRMRLLIDVPGPQVGEPRISGILQDGRLTPVADHDPLTACDLQTRHRTLLFRRDPGAQRRAVDRGCRSRRDWMLACEELRRNFVAPLALATRDYLAAPVPAREARPSAA